MSSLKISVTSAYSSWRRYLDATQASQRMSVLSYRIRRGLVIIGRQHRPGRDDDDVDVREGRKEGRMGVCSSGSSPPDVVRKHRNVQEAREPFAAEHQKAS